MSQVTKSNSLLDCTRTVESHRTGSRRILRKDPDVRGPMLAAGRHRRFESGHGLYGRRESRRASNKRYQVATTSHLRRYCAGIQSLHARAVARGSSTDRQRAAVRGHGRSGLASLVISC